jgi:hypothetical protein
VTKFSTNALTARYCKTQGWLCETVQTWRGNKRHDLFGFCDSLVLAKNTLVFVQNCSEGSLAQHRKKMQELSWIIDSIEKGCALVELWEWRRRKADGRFQWFLRVEGWGDGSPGAWQGPFDLYPKKEPRGLDVCA